jgi:hypothetical protein
MADESDIPIHHRVADSGFAEAVERHGFRRVGKAHWRMDNEETTWRIALIKGDQKWHPGSFRPMMGGLAKGIDELCEKVDGKLGSSRITGMSARAHLFDEIGQHTHDELCRAYRADPSILHREPGFRGWLKHVFTYEAEALKQVSRIPHWDEIGISGYVFGFHTKDADMSDVIASVVHCMDEYAMPLIGSLTTLDGFYRRFWSPDAKHPRPHEVYHSFAAGKLLGDLAGLQRMADAVFLPALQTEAETWRELEESGDLEREWIDYDRHPPETHVIGKMYLRLSDAKIVADAILAMDIPIGIPDFDFDLIQQYWRRAEAISSGRNAQSG